MKPKQFLTKHDGPTATSLATELGVSVSIVSQKRNRGKTDDEIRKEAVVWKEKQARIAGKDTAELEGGLESFHMAQARKERALADKHQIDVAVKLGELVSVAEVNAFVSQNIVAARDILSKISPELADRLAPETNPVTIRMLIDTEVHRALTRLSLFVPKVS